LISPGIVVGFSSSVAAVAARDYPATFGSLLLIRGTVKGKFLSALTYACFLASISASLSLSSFCSAYRSFIF
jgi:hypothetical protein